MEQKVSQEYREDEIQMMSINSVYMNRNQLVVTTKLDMHAGDNKITIQYKIDIGSDSNIMPWCIFKKLFPKVTEAELAKTINNHIKLKCITTVIAQLGMCVVFINYKDNKKKCEFFVVPGNGHALLGIADTAVLNIINVNIDSIEAASIQKENCSPNISDTEKPSTKQGNSQGKGKLYKH